MVGVSLPSATAREKAAVVAEGVPAGAASLLRGLLARGDGLLDRYGLVLDTRRSHDVLGFEPLYRIELRGPIHDRRVDSVRCR